MTKEGMSYRKHRILGILLWVFCFTVLISLAVVHHVHDVVGMEWQPEGRRRRLDRFSSFHWMMNHWIVDYILCVVLGIKTPSGNSCPCGWKQARLTYYESYPQCCSNANNNNNNNNDEECSDYNGCAYQGLFAYLPTQKSLQWVRSHNVCALFSSHEDDDIDADYANQKIRVRKGGGHPTFLCSVYDTCSDADCDGCCTRNAGTSGYLLDVEYWTVLRQYKDIDVADGNVCFQMALSS